MLCKGIAMQLQFEKGFCKTYSAIIKEEDAMLDSGPCLFLLARLGCFGFMPCCLSFWQLRECPAYMTSIVQKLLKIVPFHVKCERPNCCSWLIYNVSCATSDAASDSASCSEL